MLFEELVPGINLETTDVEFKGLLEEGKSEKEKNKEIGWLKTFAAFANAGGGTLYIGVDNRTHEVLALDHQTADRIVLMIHRQVKSRITPAITYRIHSIPVPGTSPIRYILEVVISQNRELPVTVHEGGLLGIYIRMFGRTELATPDQIRDLVLMSERIPFDQPITETSFERGQYATLFARVAERGAPLTEKELISKGFMNENGKLSRGALLFSDGCKDNITRTVATLWPGIDKGSSLILASEVYEGNLLEIIPKAVAFIQNHSTNGFRKGDTTREDYVAYPPRSVTEGIVNAIGHRNYFMFGTQIEINIFRDRLEITSPGSLLGVRELQKEKNISSIIPRRRNEVICDVLEMCRYMEEKGSGFDKIADDYRNYDERFQPYISSNASCFTLTLPDLTFRYGVLEDTTQIPEIFADGILTGKSDEKILAFCFAEERTVKEIAEYLGVTGSTYFRKSVIGRLVREGYLLERVARPVRYRSNPERVRLRA